MNNMKIPSILSKLLSIEEIMIFKELQIKIKELNERCNLTRLIEGNDYWISQVYDSIWTFKDDSTQNFDFKKFIDIGTGCGFPGFAYAITHPNSEIYMVDSSKKKTESLKKIIKNINFKNEIHVIHDRIENIAHQYTYRNSFDIGTVRAVSNPSTVAEYLLPMLNKKGIGILYCGKWGIQDTENLKKALFILKGKILKIKNINLPNNRGERNNIFISPVNLCPKNYPRAIGRAEKYPL